MMMKELYTSPEATLVSFVASQNIAAEDAEIPFSGMDGALLQDAGISVSDIEMPL